MPLRACAFSSTGNPRSTRSWLLGFSSMIQCPEPGDDTPWSTFVATKRRVSALRSGPNDFSPPKASTGHRQFATPLASSALLSMGVLIEGAELLESVVHGMWSRVERRHSAGASPRQFFLGSADSFIIKNDRDRCARGPQPALSSSGPRKLKCQSSGPLLDLFPIANSGQGSVDHHPFGDAGSGIAPPKRSPPMFADCPCVTRSALLIFQRIHYGPAIIPRPGSFWCSPCSGCVDRPMPAQVRHQRTV